MKKASKVISASLAAALTLSMASYGAAAIGTDSAMRVAMQGVEEQTAVSYATPQAQSEVMDKYLFVHFIGDGNEKASPYVNGYNSEQIYFSVSEDGTTWETLNGVNPILTSTVGELGLRDPHILRRPDGQGFYMIATDLSIYRRKKNEIGEGNAWGDCQRRGSKSLVVWESPDLVHWSGGNLVRVAADEAGCTWAPESFWHKERQQYMVFWSSMVNGRQRIYRCFTSDYKTFTEPEIYLDGGNRSWIDGTYIEEDGVYYRFVKDEGVTAIHMEKSTSLDGPFESVNTYTIDGQPGYLRTGYEGPTAYKMADGKYCLVMDGFGSTGCVPFYTDDITTGHFTQGEDFVNTGLKASGKGEQKFRHGTIIPITTAEYNSLKATVPGMDSASGDLVYSLTFNGGLATGSERATAVGSITYGTDSGHHYAEISGSGNYIQIDGSMVAGLEEMTVSFYAKAAGTSWMFYAAPNGDDIALSGTQSNYIAAAWGIDINTTGVGVQRYKMASNGTRPPSATGAMEKNAWKKVTVVLRKDYTLVYVDNELVGSAFSQRSVNTVLGDNPVIYLGRASWVGGEYSNYQISDLKIYNRALDKNAVASI